ncbi:MAG: enoyl-CoA hydratase/isomerase family protein [Myxococcota bacterium]
MNEIRIEGPGKNALGTPLMQQLLDAVRAAEGGPLLLTGAGDAFSAGLDLKEVHAADTDGMKRFLVLLTDLVAALHHHPGPTVAAVNGHAIAGGCLLALVCDVRIATTEARARIGLNEVALGLRFPPRVFRMARSRLSATHENEILLGAGLHGPVDAQRLGLVDRLDADPVAAGRAALEKLASYPADAYAAAKRDLRAGSDPIDPSEEERFIREILPVWAGPELKARIAGFVKR